MLSAIRLTLIGIGLGLIMIGVVGVLCISQAQAFLTGQVETILSEAFGTTASVGTVSLSTSKGALVLHNFALHNPPGFKQGAALECERVEIELRPTTLLDDSKTIKRVYIEGADVRYRYEVGRGTNIGTIARGLSRDVAAETTRYKIEELRCEGARLHLSANVFPVPDVPLNVVAVELHNLGNGAAITPGKATSIFLRSVLVETLTMKGLLNPVAGKMREEVSAIGDS